MKILTCFLIWCGALSVSFAQNTIVAADNQTTTPDHMPTPVDEIDWANFENELVNAPTEPWSFQKNKAGNLLYIDFENLGNKMERLTLQSSEDEIVFADNHLFDLPINTIYELNLDKLPIGVYFVELYTFDGTIIKEEITVD
jgi:hypothetical protein